MKSHGKAKTTREERIFLALLLCLALFFTFDATRPPPQQVSVRLFRFGVQQYRAHLHPLTSHFIRCRFNPTCSGYALEAVERFGIARGLVLSVHRLWSCRGSVPLGTYDPVPAK